jgi:hypothetical protein
MVSLAMGLLHWLEIDWRFYFRSFLGFTYRYSPQEGTAFERVVQTLTLMQAIEAEPALDHVVREIDLPAIGSGDNAVTLIVVIGNEPRVQHAALLRQMDESNEFSGRH